MMISTNVISAAPVHFINGMGGNGSDLVVVGHFGQVTTSNDGGI
jgi:hypothetical protein